PGVKRQNAVTGRDSCPRKRPLSGGRNLAAGGVAEIGLQRPGLTAIWLGTAGTTTVPAGAAAVADTAAKVSALASGGDRIGTGRALHPGADAGQYAGAERL